MSFCVDPHSILAATSAIGCDLYINGCPVRLYSIELDAVFFTCVVPCHIHGMVVSDSTFLFCRHPHE